MITHKYQFIIEKYGYLTETEKSNLINDMKSQGFIVENVNISAPDAKKSYGEMITFTVDYKYPQSVINYSKNNININNKYIDLKVTKVCFSKN